MSEVRVRHNWFLINFSRLFFSAYFKLFHGFEVTGVKNIPREGPVLLAPNHQSYYDAPLVGIKAPRLVTFLTLKKYCDAKSYGWFINNTGALSIGSTNDRKAYRDMIATLTSGNCLTVYPEGSRSPTGELEKLQSGPARMALSTGTPIVPVSITGAFEAWPRTKTFPALCTKIIVKYHQPIPCEKVKDKRELRRRIVEVNEQLERTLARRLAAWKRLQERKRRSAERDNQRQ